MRAVSRRTVVRSAAQTVLMSAVAVAGGAAADLRSPATSVFCSLLARYRALESDYKRSPFDISRKEEDRLYRAWTDICLQLEAAPIVSDQEALEAMRLADSRFSEDETAGYLDRALVRNVRIFLESKGIHLA